jgi:hypothetical protein
LFYDVSILGQPLHVLADDRDAVAFVLAQDLAVGALADSLLASVSLKKNIIRFLDLEHASSKKNHLINTYYLQ